MVFRSGRGNGQLWRALNAGVVETAITLVAVGGTGLAFLIGSVGSEPRPSPDRKALAVLEQQVETLSRENAELRYREHLSAQAARPSQAGGVPSRVELLRQIQTLVDVAGQIPESAVPD